MSNVDPTNFGSRVGPQKLRGGSHYTETFILAPIFTPFSEQSLSTSLLAPLIKLSEPKILCLV